MEYFILEELDSDAYTFLHSITVNKLIKDELVPSSIGVDVEALRDLLIELLQNKRRLEDIRNDSQWKYARSLAKSILDKLD